MSIGSTGARARLVRPGSAAVEVKTKAEGWSDRADELSQHTKQPDVEAATAWSR